MEGEQARTEAAEAIDRALEVVEEQGWEPDPWERLFIVQVVNALFRDCYRLAVVDAEFALTPPSERSRKPVKTDAFMHRCNCSLLREALRHADGEASATLSRTWSCRPHGRKS
jgi:hypothetical protein